MNWTEFIMKHQIISNCFLGEYFKRDLKVVRFSELFLQKQNINTPFKSTHAGKAGRRAFHSPQ